MDSKRELDSKRNVLVIVGRSVAGSELVAELTPRAAGEVGFTLLMPATPLAGAFDAEADWADALARAKGATDVLRGAGLDVIEAIVGDADFAAAAGDVLHSREIDDVVVLVDPGAALAASPALVAV
jgi:hypothetical protein